MAHHRLLISLCLLFTALIPLLSTHSVHAAIDDGIKSAPSADEAAGTIDNAVYEFPSKPAAAKEGTSSSSSSSSSSTPADEEDEEILRHTIFNDGDELLAKGERIIRRRTRFSYAPILDPLLPSIEGSHVMTAYLNSSFNVQPNMEVFIGQKLVDQLFNTDMLHTFIDKFSGYRLPIDAIDVFLGSPQFFGWITSRFEVLKWMGMCNLQFSNLRIQKARIAPVATEETPKRVVTLLDDRIRIAVTGLALIMTLDYQLTGTDRGLIHKKMLNTKGSVWIRLLDNSITLDVKATFDADRRVPILKTFTDEQSRDVFRVGKISMRFDRTFSNSFHNVIAYVVHKTFGKKLTKVIVDVSTDELSRVSGTINLRLYGLMMTTINDLFRDWGVSAPKMPELIALNFGWKVKQQRFILSSRLVAIKREGRKILEGAVEELSHFSYEMEKLSPKKRATIIWSFKRHLAQLKRMAQTRRVKPLRPKTAPLSDE